MFHVEHATTWGYMFLHLATRMLWGQHVCYIGASPGWGGIVSYKRVGQVLHENQCLSYIRGDRGYETITP